MKPLIVLLISFGIALLAIKLLQGDYDFAFAARIAMAAMLIFTSIAHFAFAKGMIMMVPDFIPFKKAMVFITGFIEIAFAVALLISKIQVLTGWALIIFFVLLLPANIYAAIKRVDYQKGTYEGSSINYLWFRVPLQLFFIAWVYFSAIYTNIFL